MVSMEAGRAFGYRDDSSRVPTLSLGLSSVRLIVNKFESQYTRVIASDDHKQLSKYDPNIDEGYDDSPLDHSRGRVFFQSLGSVLSRWIPSVSFGNFGVLAVATGLFAPKMLSYLVLYPFCRLVFGTLYPAYASYKAVRTKNLKEYVKWMMYWIVFALFTCTETITDVFLSWFPFYYEVKIVLVLWLLSPATKGSSILYRKFVHPALCRREQEIDEYIAKAKDQGYHTVLNLGSKGVNYATTVIMQTAIKGGGGIVQQIRKSYSLSDLTECDPREERGGDEADDVMTEPRVIRRVPKSGYNTRRSASESNSRSPMYFPEVDVDVRPRPRSDEPDFSHIKSTEDISSGYSSADNSVSLTRTASLGARARSRTGRTTVTTIKRPQAAEGSEVIIEELRDEDLEYENMPSLVNLPAQIFMSHTNPPFLYQYIGDQVRIIQVLGDNSICTKNDQNTEKVGNKEITVQTTDNELAKDSKSSNTDYSDEISQDSAKDKAEITKATETLKESEPLPGKNVTNEISDVLETVETENITKNVVSNELDQITDSKEKPLESETDIKEKDISTAKESVDNNVNSDKIDINTGNVKDLDQKRSSKDDGTISSPSLNDSAESGDDEASFGTPDNSPKTKRKLAKGKYGKPKAPPPPIDNKSKEDIKNVKTDKRDLDVYNTSQESLIDIVNRLPNTAFKETGNYRGQQIVNPISENKRRHKSKSPGNISKGNTSTIGRLLQLPAKLAFWKDDKSKSDVSETSDHSRRSSNVDQGVIDEFQSCADLTKFTSGEIEKTDDQISFKDTFFDGEDIAKDIIDKSDALQKLIEAKIENHPEYKIIALHAEIPTTSKSTDV